MLSKVAPQKGKPFNLIKNKNKPQITTWHKLIFLSPIFAIILIIKGNDWYRDYQLSNNGIETYALITKISSVGIRDAVEINNVEFEFKNNDSIIKGYTVAEIKNKYAVSENGMPLFINDEFIVRYVKDNPEIYELKYDKPSDSTIEKYILFTSEVIQNTDIYNKSNILIKQCDCLANNIYKKYNLDGLATLIFYDELIVDNISHNSIVFNKFINKKEVKELIQSCK